MPQKKHVVVLGGGAWGTALAAMSARCGHKVFLYARNEESVAEINAYHMNSRYLPSIVLPKTIIATARVQEVLSDAEIIFFAIPMQFARAVFSSFGPFIPTSVPLILCSKGIERGTGFFLSDIAKEFFSRQPLAVLSGPGFAREVASGFPTAVTLAAYEKDLVKNLSSLFSKEKFRCYASTDMTGVEIGGALKNVLALATGMANGRGLGASAQASLITRGFAELRRIGIQLGGRPETMTGLSVLGDLILTCSSPQSRNFSYGVAIGRGESTKGLPLAEGVTTAPVAVDLCHRHNIKAPVIQSVVDIISKAMSIDTVINSLLARPIKFED